MSNDADKQKHMTEAANRLKEMIDARMKSRAETLQQLNNISAMDNIPESVHKMREQESEKIRLVMQEQKDIIECIKMIFPDA